MHFRRSYLSNIRLIEEGNPEIEAQLRDIFQEHSNSDDSELVLSLLLAEQPDAIQKISAKSAEEFCRTKSCPQLFMSQLAFHPAREVREKILDSLNIPQTVFKTLLAKGIERSKVNLHRCFGGFPKSVEEVEDDFWKLIFKELSSESILADFARADLLPDLLKKRITPEIPPDKIPGAITMTAKHPLLNTVKNPDWNSLLSERDPHMLEAMASRADCPVEILEKLSNCLGSLVRALVAAHPHSPEELVMKLAQEKSWQIRCGAAINPNLSDGVFKLLKKDTSPRVRQALELNPTVLQKSVLRICKSGTYEQRLTLALLPECPNKIRTALADSTSKERSESVFSALTARQDLTKKERQMLIAVRRKALIQKVLHSKLKTWEKEPILNFLVAAHLMRTGELLIEDINILTKEILKLIRTNKDGWKFHYLILLSGQFPHELLELALKSPNRLVYGIAKHIQKHPQLKNAA